MTYAIINFGSASLVSGSLLGEGISVCQEEHDTFNAVAAKCDQACRILTRLYQNNPIQPDLVPSYEALQAWPFIVSAYSGIEQSIKVLLKMSNIEYPNSGRGGHRLDGLFGRLLPPEKTVIRKSFDVYQSLHYYINFTTVDEFLSTISNGSGHSGYDDWRYLLMDFQASLISARVPMNHAGAMIEVWTALSNILIAKTVTDHGLRTVADRIENKIASCLTSTSQQQPYRVDNEQFLDLKRWLDSAGSNINAYADFYHAFLNQRPAVYPIAQRIEDFLEGSIPHARDLAKEDQDFKLFLYLAEHTLVKWNQTTKRFASG